MARTGRNPRSPKPAVQLIELRANSLLFDLAGSVGALPRRFILHIDGVAEAESVAPSGETMLKIPIARPVEIGTRLQLIEADTAMVVADIVIDAAAALAVANRQIAALQADLAALRTAQVAQPRVTVPAPVPDLAQQRLLLDRLDLFYLLLSERIDRAVGPAAPPAAVGSLPAVQYFGPDDIEGIGIFDVESNGEQTWRWFGPDATIALRGAPAGARRVVLYFHSFVDAEPPEIRVAIAGLAERVSIRPLERGFAVDIPLHRADAWPGAVLIVHISFDRYQTSAADPRLLAAVFSGAEIIAAPS